MIGTCDACGRLRTGLKHVDGFGICQVCRSAPDGGNAALAELTRARYRRIQAKQSPPPTGHVLVVNRDEYGWWWWWLEVDGVMQRHEMGTVAPQVPAWVLEWNTPPHGPFVHNGKKRASSAALVQHKGLPIQYRVKGVEQDGTDVVTRVRGRNAPRRTGAVRAARH